MMHIYSRFRLVYLLVLALSTWPAYAETFNQLRTVSQLNLDRYSGRWYEISRLPMWFERNCVDEITANYTPRKDGRIDVLNRCRTKDDFIAAHGIAEVTDPAYPGRLRVRFAPEWLSWLPIVWGDYWIMDLDPDYRWVMVGSPSRSYLWILSRTPTLDATTVQRLKQAAADQGFGIGQMIDVVNTGE